MRRKSSTSTTKSQPGSGRRILRWLPKISTVFAVLMLQGVLVSAIGFGLRALERRVLIKAVVVKVNQPTNLSNYLKIKNVEDLLAGYIGQPYISLKREELLEKIKLSSDVIRDAEVDSSLEYTLVGTLKINIDVATAEAMVLQKNTLWYVSESGSLITKVKGGTVTGQDRQLERVPLIWLDQQENNAQTMQRIIQDRSLIQASVSDAMKELAGNPSAEVEEIQLTHKGHPELRVLLKLENGSAFRILCRFHDMGNAGKPELQAELNRLRGILRYISKKEVYPAELDFRFGRRVIARSR